MGEDDVGHRCHHHLWRDDTRVRRRRHHVWRDSNGEGRIHEGGSARVLEEGGHNGAVEIKGSGE